MLFYSVYSMSRVTSRHAVVCVLRFVIKSSHVCKLTQKRYAVKHTEYRYVQKICGLSPWIYYCTHLHKHLG